MHWHTHKLHFAMLNSINLTFTTALRYFQITVMVYILYLFWESIPFECPFFPHSNGKRWCDGETKCVKLKFCLVIKLELSSSTLNLFNYENCVNLYAFYDYHEKTFMGWILATICFEMVCLLRAITRRSVNSYIESVIAIKTFHLCEALSSIDNTTFAIKLLLKCTSHVITWILLIAIFFLFFPDHQNGTTIFEWQRTFDLWRQISKEN